MRLGVIRFLKLLLASFFIQSSWSFFSMQAMGFLFNLSLGVKDREKKREIFRTHKGFYNTHPYMSSYIVGATVRAYDRGDKPEDILRFLSVAQTSFASVGDQLFWQTVRPCLLLAGTIIGIKFGWFGPAAFFILFNLLHLYHRGTGLVEGYRRGWDVIYLLKARRVAIPQRLGETAGALCLGFLLVLSPHHLRALMILPLTALFLILLIRKFPAVLIIVLILVIFLMSVIFMI
jgi:mannose/fructose/N-acetylgalactosamine-specific phosphotransferase system component IID